MATFKIDNPLLRLDLTLADLACISRVKGPSEIKPEHAPFLTGVESVVERNAKTGSEKKVSRYHLVFPGSGFMRIMIKVEEAAPSISQDTIDQCGGAVRINIEGFSSGVFEVDGGSARPYFRAERITPVQATK